MKTIEAVTQINHSEDNMQHSGNKKIVISKEQQDRINMVLEVN